jgi:hypothetical protein
MEVPEMKLRLAHCKSCRAWKHRSEVTRVPAIVGKLFCHDCLSKIAAEKRAG